MAGLGILKSRKWHCRSQKMKVNGTSIRRKWNQIYALPVRYWRQVMHDSLVELEYFGAFLVHH